MRTIMAFITQKRRAGLEQRRNVGTVRGMAIGAILRDRLMFPEIRPAFVGMAGETGFGDGVFNQQFRAG